MAIGSPGRKLRPTIEDDRELVEIKLMLDRDMDAALRERVLKKGVNRSVHLRKLIEADLKRAASKT